MPLFESRTLLNATPDQVFQYIICPANLQDIAPPETQFVFVDPPSVIELGSQLICKVQAYGMVQQLSYEIVDCVAPLRFSEEMTHGPLKRWRHDYIIEPDVDGGVFLINRIEFEPPAGLMGLVVTAAKILEDLEDGFHYRREALRKVFR